MTKQKDIKIEDKEMSVVKTPFFKGTLWQRITHFNPQKVIQTLNQPLLFFIKSDGFVDVIENVRVGRFNFTTQDGRPSFILLEARKIQALRYGKDTYRCWIAYENESVAYPVDVKHDAKSIFRIIKEVAANHKLLDNDSKLSGNAKFWLILIFILIMAGYFFLQTDYGRALTTAHQATQIAGPVITNTAGNLNLTPGIVPT